VKSWAEIKTQKRLLGLLSAIRLSMEASLTCPQSVALNPLPPLKIVITRCQILRPTVGAYCAPQTPKLGKDSGYGVFKRESSGRWCHLAWPWKKFFGIITGGR